MLIANWILKMATPTLSIKPYARNTDVHNPVKAAGWFGALKRGSRRAGARLVRWHRRFYPARPGWHGESERGGRLVMWS
jgi:hypothetical protein